MASGSEDKTIKIWDIRSQRLIQHYDAHSDHVNEIDFHPNGRYLLSSSNDSTLKVWDLRQGHILFTLYGHRDHQLLRLSHHVVITLLLQVLTQ